MNAQQLENLFNIYDLLDKSGSFEISLLPERQLIKAETLTNDYGGGIQASQSSSGGGSVSTGLPPHNAEIDLNLIDISDEYIDSKLKLAFCRTRSGRIPGVKVELKGTTGIWEVVEDYTYKIGSSDGVLASDFPACTLTVPRGFQYDRASIPRIFWVIISKDDLSNVPALYHDLLYRFGGRVPAMCIIPPELTFSRKQADDLFNHLMKETGVIDWRRKLAYQAVRGFSGFAWQGY